MPVRRILQFGDPMLRQVSSPVADPPSARLLLDDMNVTLAEFRRVHGWGRGISAVQIGELSRVIFLRVDGVPYELINPAYTWQSPETFELWDDCFSFPQLMVRLSRFAEVEIGYQTIASESRILRATGSLSELIQHEMDHLDGILTVDRAAGTDAFSTREEWERQRRGR